MELCASGTWAKANFDRQITAIAKSEGGHTIYTDDHGLAKHAKRAASYSSTMSDKSVVATLNARRSRHEQLQKLGRFPESISLVDQ
jgi:hypothetical protein